MAPKVCHKAESLSKVFPGIGIGPWMVLPSPRIKWCQMAVLQMVVFRHRQWVRTLSGTIGANANRALRKEPQGEARKCVGGFASRQRGTHLQVALGYVKT